jgi:hypothetical protein
MWWEKTDREEVIRAARALSTGKGILILRGDDLSGREAAVRIAVDILEETLGYHCYGSSQRETSGNVRTALALLLNSIDPPASPGGFGAALANESLPSIVDAVLARLPTLPNPAMILEEVDYTERVLPGAQPLLSDLATKSNCPLVIGSRSESGTDWRSMPGATLIDLAGFSVDDVKAAAWAARDLRHRDVEEIDAAVDTAFGSAVDIEPLYAYAVMRGLV